MKLLIVVPHESLVGPQGAEQRLRAFEQMFSEDDVVYLLPDSIDAAQKIHYARKRAYYFQEPGIFGRKIPFLLDRGGEWLAVFARVLKAERIDLAVFSFPWGLSAAAKNCSLPLVYFSHGVEADFTEITLAQFRLDWFPLRPLFRAYIARLEQAALRSAALVLTICEGDKLRFEELYGGEKKHCEVFPQPVQALQNMPEKSEARNRLGLPESEKLVLFHGTYGHLPNREAIHELREVIAPQLRATCPEARVVIAGSKVPRFESESSIGLGFVPDLPTLLAACDIAVVPIFRGCGVRMKIFDYLAAGLPCVSTKKGAEGLGLVAGRDAILSENTSADLLSALIEVINDVELKQRISRSGFEFLEKYHDPERIGARLMETLGSLQSSQT